MNLLQRVKKYWDDRPCNIRHSKEPVGTRNYFNEVEYKKYKVEPHISGFADFNKWKDKKVLEIGCGLGTETINFARAGARVVAVDMSEKSLELAKKRAEVFGLSDKITFYQGNAEELDKFIPAQKFDLIWSFGVIHHTPNPENVIECIKKYLSPSSELRMMVYNKFSWKVFWILFKYGKFKFWDIDKFIAQNSEAQTGCPITYTYTNKSVQKLLKGFVIDNIKIEHIFPYKIREYKENKFKFIWYFRYLPKWFFHWLEKRIGWHMCIIARWRI